MTGDCHVRFCEGLGVKFPGATRQDRSTNLRKHGRVPRADVRSDLIHRPGVGTSLGKAGVMTHPKRFKSLLFYEVGKAALMEWRASWLGRDDAVRAPKPRSGAHLRGA
jgi:hypothetical protein